MIYVKVPKEIKEYEDKILLGLSLRQLLYGGVTLLFTVLTYFFVLRYVGEQFGSYVVMLIAIPGFALGFAEIDGLKLDQYLKIRYRFYMRKQILTYSDECYLWEKKRGGKHDQKKERQKYREKDF